MRRYVHVISGGDGESSDDNSTIPHDVKKYSKLNPNPGQKDSQDDKGALLFFINQRVFGE